MTQPFHVCLYKDRKEEALLIDIDLFDVRRHPVTLYTKVEMLICQKASPSDYKTDSLATLTCTSATEGKV